VNAAGLWADDVAALAGLDPDALGLRLAWVKGSYFRLRGRGGFRHLVYPVPLPALAGLGVHVTLDLDGGVRLGPDVEPLDPKRLDYAVDEARGDAFFASVSRWVEGISRADLYPDQAGIRPRRRVPAGEVPDFVVAEETERGLPGWVNLVGIESPGITASMAIAERVAALLRVRGAW
jgi:L-2-hydroxyglutarate oxidase LhgO